jgi:hypothetical protein
MADYLLAADVYPKVAQVRDGNITAYDASTTYKVTINGRTVSQVGTGGTTTTTATAFATALNASTIPEFAEITWSSSTSHVIGTCDTAGKSFTCTSSVSGGTGTFGAFSDTTSNDGSEALTANNVKNASTGARALPSNSDTLTIETLGTDLKYGLDALSGVTLANLYIEASMTGNVGLEPINSDGAQSYDEYRQAYLQAPATVCTIGAGEGNGSGLVCWDAGSVQTTCEVRSTGSAGVDGLKAAVLKGTHASNVFKVESGSVDFAPFAGETATIATLTVTGDADVRASTGVSLGTVNAGGSSTLLIDQVAALADITALNVNDSATVTIYGDNATTTATINGTSPTLDYRSSGTITTLNLYDGATFDMTNNPTGCTVTTINALGKCTIKDPNGKLTVTNAITAGLSLVTWEVTPKRSITLGAA